MENTLYKGAGLTIVVTENLVQFDKNVGVLSASVSHESLECELTVRAAGGRIGTRN